MGARGLAMVLAACEYLYKKKKKKIEYNYILYELGRVLKEFIDKNHSAESQKHTAVSLNTEDLFWRKGFWR